MLVGPENQVELLDFGIAKILPESGKELQKLTQTGDIFGTVLYMSPEQCQANPLDARSDLYSMGCIMYEVLDGEPPLQGDAPYATIAKHLYESPRASDYLADDFGSVVLAALEKDPAQRPQSAMELKAALSDPTFFASRHISKEQKQKSNSARLTSIALVLSVLSFAGLYALNQHSSDLRGEALSLCDRQDWDAVLRVRKERLLSGQDGAQPRELAYDYFSIGQCYTEKQDYKQAMLNLKKCTEQETYWDIWRAAKVLEADCLLHLDAARADAALKTFAEKLERDQQLNKPKDIAWSQFHLGECYQIQGKLAEAEQSYKSSLAIREKSLPANDPDIAWSQFHLGECYRLQGKFAEAEPLFRQSLAIREKALGPNHLDVAESLILLAKCYCNQSKNAEAEPLCRQSLAIREKALGPNHLDVADSLILLANCYCNQSKFVVAEPLCRQSLAIREKALGPNHLDVAASLTLLANCYCNQGKNAEAEPLCRQSLAIREKALGPSHLDVAATLILLAGCYCNQSKNAEAEPLCRQSLAIREKALGPNHLDVAATLILLANCYCNQGKNAEAEPLYKRGLAIREEALGPSHLHVAATLILLADCYCNQSKNAEAEPLYKRLAALYRTQGKTVEAKEWEARAEAIRAVKK